MAEGHNAKSLSKGWLNTMMSLFAASKILLNVLLTESSNPCRLIGAVLETNTSARAFISSMAQGQDALQNICVMNTIATSI